MTVTSQQEMSNTLNSSQIPKDTSLLSFGEITFTFGDILEDLGFGEFLFCCWGVWYSLGRGPPLYFPQSLRHTKVFPLLMQLLLTVLIFLSRCLACASVSGSQHRLGASDCASELVFAPCNRQMQNPTSNPPTPPIY